MQNFSIALDQYLDVGRDSNSDKARTPSPSKIKLPFFEGFRNTFRARARSEDVDYSNGDLVQSLNISRRLSETQTSMESMGSAVACVVSDWQAAEAGQISLRRGERVRILKHSKANGYFVQKLRNSSLTSGMLSSEEGWVPTHAIAFASATNTSNGPSKKPWSFKFRKPSFNSGTTAGILRKRADRRFLDSLESQDISDVNGCSDGGSSSSLEAKIEILCKLVDLTVAVGDQIQMTCQVHVPSHFDMKNINVVWRKQVDKETGLSSCLIEGGRYSIYYSDGLARLTISDCHISDAGIYSCTVNANDMISSSVTTTACLTVNACKIGQPRVRALSPTTALVVWDGDPSVCYTLYHEQCNVTSQGDIENVNTVGTTQYVLGLSHCVDGLQPGCVYVFRVSNSLPSEPLLLPMPTSSNQFSSSRWQQEQFGRRYLEKEVLGRGRYAVVKRAQDRGTGQQVAAKQVHRIRQAPNITHAEYSVMLGLQHQSIVKAFALFESSPLSEVDTIIMELVSGPMLLAYVCQEDTVSEKTVNVYMLQLFSALDYLHNKKIVHFDIRPENILVDLSNLNPVLKLIDLGESVHRKHLQEITPPASLEFAAPECVLGQPAGPPCDVWGAAVYLYVFLSGLSPFLDESVEETTANVLKCDYSFPDEYFGTVSQDAKSLISRILMAQPNHRISASDAINCSWFQMSGDIPFSISTSRLSLFVNRRQPLHNLLS